MHSWFLNLRWLLGRREYELDKYLGKDNEENKKVFDILKWWKDNATGLSKLLHMSHDLVAIFSL